MRLFGTYGSPVRRDGGRDGLGARAGARERGQSLVELALLVPLMTIMLACAVDFGRFMILNATVESAADQLARAVESNPAMTQEQAADYIADAYPELAEGTAVTVSAPVRTEETVSYKINKPGTGTFESRPSKVAQDTYAVRVEHTADWFTPALIAVSHVAGSGNTFTVGASASAVVDKTLEEW